MKLRTVLALMGVLSMVPPPAIAESGPELAVRQRPSTALLDRSASIRVDVDLVMVPVTVTDPRARVVSGLAQDHFQVFEDKTQQTIVSFSMVDTPASIGLVFDTSGSMHDKIDKAREATKEFFSVLNPDDEVFLMTFASRPTVRTEFSSEFSGMQNGLLPEQAKGHTALIDAVYLALDQMREARNSRRALVVVSDGMDNNSRYSAGDLLSIAVEADTQIYTIGIHARLGYGDPSERIGTGRAMDLLDDMANTTGGIHFTIRNYGDLADIMQKVGVALHNQYLIGYRPAEENRDDKWRRIRVRVDPPNGFPRLNVYARRGYYGPGSDR